MLRGVEKYFGSIDPTEEITFLTLSKDLPPEASDKVEFQYYEVMPDKPAIYKEGESKTEEKGEVYISKEIYNLVHSSIFTLVDNYTAQTDAMAIEFVIRNDTPKDVVLNNGQAVAQMLVVPTAAGVASGQAMIKDDYKC